MGCACLYKRGKNVCTWDRIEKGTLEICVYWKGCYVYLSHPSRYRRECLYHVPSMWPSVSSSESLLCGGFSGLLWGLFKELSGVKPIPREGGAGLGNVLEGTGSSRQVAMIASSILSRQTRSQDQK